MQRVISRAEARSLGLTRYFTGKPCKHGHVSERLVSSTKCCECRAIYIAEWAKANSQRLAAYQKQYAAVNREAVNANKQAYTRRHPDRVSEAQRRHHEKNRVAISERQRLHKQKNREQIAARMRRYNAENRGRVNALAAKYKATKLRATPPWADLEAIRRIYEQASAAGLEVDHEIPLQGRLVCGLHVENNLRAIPAHANRRKSAKFEVL